MKKVILCVVTGLFIAACGGSKYPLADAILANDVAKVKKVLAEGKKPGAHELTLQNSFRNKDIMKALLGSGINANMPALTGGNALNSCALSDRNIASLKLLLAAGAKPGQFDMNDSTPLMGACFNGEELSVKALLEAGADMTLKNKKGETAFYRAVKNRKPKVVKILMDAGGDPRKELDPNGDTLLQYARAQYRDGKGNAFFKEVVETMEKNLK